MPSLWDKAKAGAKRTKLQGELVMLEREIKGRKAAFGVELYDILSADPKSFGGNIMGQNVKVSQLHKPELSEPYELCKADIYDLEAQQQSFQKEQDHLAHQRESFGPATTTGEHFSKAGNWMTTNAQEIGLTAKAKMLDRDIKKRKETFGIIVYEQYVATGLAEPDAPNAGVKAKVSSVIGNFSPKEKKVQDCLYRSKNMVEMLERQKNLNLAEIDELNKILGAPKDEQS